MKKSLANREKIFLTLEKIPGQKATEIARNLGISHVSVYLHLEQLIQE
jgi:predicted ArsR family transcriptional regulator